MMVNLSRKIYLPLLVFAALTSGSCNASDSSHGLNTHVGGSTGAISYMYYDNSADRWYVITPGGSVFDSLDGKYLRNNMVTEVTNGIANETTERQKLVNEESKAQADEDARLSEQISELKNNGVRYSDDTYANITLSPTGTTIQNLTAGNISKGSTDAVTGGQLYVRNEAISQTTLDRKKVLQNESDLRKQADADLLSKIGSLSGKETYYLDKSQSLSSNLSRLDKILTDTDNNIENEKAELADSLKKLSDSQQKADAEIDKAIGTYDNSYSSNYIKHNEPLNGNLLLLDQAIDPLKDKLASESEKNKHAFDNEIIERDNADKALSDRLGTFSNQDQTIYLDPSKNISQNLVILDGENQKTAAAIKQEILEREAQIKEISDHLNDGTNQLKAELGTIGASGATLAALSYEEYTLGNKWSFAGSQGNYRNKNAAAFGIRYFFGPNTSIQFATTLGQSKLLWGGSTTVRVGQQSKEKEISAEMKELMEIRQLAHKAESQKVQIEEVLFLNKFYLEDDHVSF